MSGSSSIALQMPAHRGTAPNRVGCAVSLRQKDLGLQLHPEPVENRYWEGFSDHFDAVTLWEVIEHVNDPLATVRGTCRLLKPGGLIFLETPSRTAPAYRLSEWCYRRSRGQFSLFLGNFYAPIPFGHKQIFTPAQLSALMEDNGFQVLFRGNAFPGDPEPLLKNRGKIILVARKKIP